MLIKVLLCHMTHSLCLMIESSFVFFVHKAEPANHLPSCPVIRAPLLFWIASANRPCDRQTFFSALEHVEVAENPAPHEC